MLDIIITAYNNHEKVLKTLSSIAMQTNKELVNVYIVNNGSNKNYKNEINTFKDLKIKELQINKNSSLGYARDFAIDNSNGDYIIFMDAGEEFFTCYAISALYDPIKNDYDVINGRYYLYYGSINNMLLIDNPEEYADINAKVYKRKFLINNKIRFNYSKECETDSFQNLVNNFTSNQKTIDDIISVIYLKEKDYDEKLKFYILFLHNRLWLIHELARRNIDTNQIINTYINSYLYIFSEISDKVDDYKYKKLFKHCRKFEKDFCKYESLIDEKSIKKLMMDYYSITDIQAEYMINDFNNFRKYFYEKDV